MFIPPEALMHPSKRSANIRGNGVAPVHKTEKLGKNFPRFSALIDQYQKDTLDSKERESQQQAQNGENWPFQERRKHNIPVVLDTRSSHSKFAQLLRTFT